MKLLLAEDETDLARALVAVLSRSGYDVDTVENGVEAVENAENNAYDCMVFDIMMPVMDGIEALKRIRGTGDKTPVIMLTAKAEIDDRIVGLDAGADDYLTKPFAMGELMARIRSLTRRNTSYTPTKLTVGKVVLDTEDQELKNENSIRLGGRKEIYEKVWENDDDRPEGKPEDVVWMYVSFLRDKLKAIDADIYIDGEQGGNFKLSRK